EPNWTGLGSATSGIAAPPSSGTASKVAPGASERSMRSRGPDGRQDAASGCTSEARSPGEVVVVGGDKAGVCEAASDGEAVGALDAAVGEGEALTVDPGASEIAAIATATATSPPTKSARVRIAARLAP